MEFISIVVWWVGVVMGYIIVDSAINHSSVSFTLQMFGVWNKIVLLTTFLIPISHVDAFPECYCTSDSNIAPVFINNGIYYPEPVLDNKCFSGSIHGKLFCPENEQVFLSRI